MNLDFEVGLKRGFKAKVTLFFGGHAREPIWFVDYGDCTVLKDDESFFERGEDRCRIGYGKLWLVVLNPARSWQCLVAKGFSSIDVHAAEGEPFLP